MRQPTERFSDRTGEYSRHRPTYPGEAVEAIVAGVPSLAGAGVGVCADVGAGTGISSRLIAERGWEVFAIEPNGPMRERGRVDEREWRESERAGAGGTDAAMTRRGTIRWVDGTGERTGLTSHSVDLVLCAQSFHWVRPQEGLAEFRRILRREPGAGRVAMMWNVHDVRLAQMAEYREIIMRHATDPPRSPWFRDEPCALAGAVGFANYRRLEFGHGHGHDENGLIGRAVSSSYCPKNGPGHESLVRDLKGLFARYASDGVFEMRYVCEVHLAERDAGGD